MKFNIQKQIPILIATVVVILVCLLEACHVDFLERMERMTYDQRVRLAVKFTPNVSTNLGFVFINDDTIEHVNDGSLGFQYGLYWPRHIYGRVLRELHREGAKIEAFDILFGGLRPDHAPVPAPNDTNILIGSDEYFARQMEYAQNVVMASEQGVLPPRMFRTNSLALGDISADRDSDGILRRAHAFRIYHKWHPVFQRLEDDPNYGVDLSSAYITNEPTRQVVLPRAQPNAPILIPLDKDGNFDMADLVGEKLPAGMKRYDKPFTDERMWHMGIILAAQELKLDLSNAVVNLPQGWIQLRGPNDVVRTIPVDTNGTFLVNWSMTAHDRRLAQEPFEALLAVDQLRHGFTNEMGQIWARNNSVNWTNKLVMIGSTATGNDLTDLGATPLEDETYLVSVHWNVANSVLTNQFIEKSSPTVDMLLVVLMGLLASYLTWSFRTYWASVCIFLLFTIYVVVSFSIFVKFRYWMPVVMPLMGGMLITHFCMLGYLIFFEQTEQKRVRSVFTKVVSPDVVAELLKNEKLSLTGAPRRVTVFFSDIRGFTELTDTNQEKAEQYILEHALTGEAADEIREAQARETLNTVNEYLTVVADIVIKHGGVIDKFIGDCVMAFWGAPVLNPNHALLCVRSAIETQRAVYRLNVKREVENKHRKMQNVLLADSKKPLLQLLPILVVGTGLNTGNVTAGLMGSNDKQMNYTVFGREVNLASRLESVSGRARIIISQETLKELERHDPALAQTCVPLPPEKVKGIRDPVAIFEVPWREE